jgi:hypothetical protein
MPPFRYPGPICQTKDWYDDIEDGTLARTPSPLPSHVDSPSPKVPSVALAAARPVSMADIMKGVTNVDRTDHRKFDNTFKWQAPFLADGKWALIPETITIDAAKIRDRMIDLLSGTRLAQHIYADLVVVTQKHRAERAAWILASGELGQAKTGTTQEVEQASKPAGNVVGYVHTHPTIPNFINPPSAGKSDNDFDSTLTSYPIQFVVESDRGIVWAQFLPKHTAILGRITGPQGVFQRLDPAEPAAKLMYKIISIDDWNMIQDEKEREERIKERDRLREEIIKKQERLRQRHQ